MLDTNASNCYSFLELAKHEVEMEQMQEKQNETLFLRFSGNYLSLSEWIEDQTQKGGFKNRQDFVLNLLRKEKEESEKQLELAA